MWHNYENFEKSHGKYKLIIDFSLICCDIWGTKIQKCMSGKCSHTILFRWSQFHWGFAYILKIILQLFDNFQTTLGPQPAQNERKIMKEECTGWEQLFPRSHPQNCHSLQNSLGLVTTSACQFPHQGNGTTTFLYLVEVLGELINLQKGL